MCQFTEAKSIYCATLNRKQFDGEMKNWDKISFRFLIRMTHIRLVHTFWWWWLSTFDSEQIVSHVVENPANYEQLKLENNLLSFWIFYSHIDLGIGCERSARSHFRVPAQFRHFIECRVWQVCDIQTYKTRSFRRKHHKLIESIYQRFFWLFNWKPIVLRSDMEQWRQKNGWQPRTL